MNTFTYQPGMNIPRLSYLKYVTCVAIALSLACTFSSAHPHHGSALSIVATRTTIICSKNKINFILLIEMQDLPGMNEKTKADTNKDNIISEEEVEVYKKGHLKELFSNFVITMNDKEVKTRFSGAEITNMKGIVDKTKFAVVVLGDVPLDISRYYTKLEYRNNLFRITNPDILPQGQIINNIILTVSSELDNFRIYPNLAIHQYEDPERPGYILMDIPYSRNLFVEYCKRCCAH